MVAGTLFVIYSLLAIAISVYARRRNKDFSSFVLAGRKLTVITLTLSLIATRVGGGIIIGTTWTAFSFGFLAIAYPLSATLGFLLLGMTLAKKYNKMGLYTVPQFFKNAFGSRTAYLASILVMASLTIVLAMQFIAGGVILSSLFNLQLGTAIVLFSAITIFVVYHGGMWGVAFVDILQIIVIYLALGILSLKGSQLLEARNLLSSRMFTSSQLSFSTIIAWCIASIGIALTSQGFVQRMSAIGNPQKAKMSALVAGLLVIPIGIFVTVIGLSAKHVGSFTNGAQILFYQARTLSPLISSFLLASIFIMVASAAENITHSTSIVFSHDLLPRLIGTKPEELKTVKYGVIFVGILTTAIALVSGKDIIGGLVLGMSITAAGFLPPVLAAFYWKRDSVAAFLSMAGALSIMLVGLVIPIRKFTHPTIVALVFSIVTYILVTLLRNRAISKVQFVEALSSRL